MYWPLGNDPKLPEEHKAELKMAVYTQNLQGKFTLDDKVPLKNLG